METINNIEACINANLIEKGSLGKFIFRDNANQWFIFYKKGNVFEIEYLKYGFWRHFKTIFTDRRQIYEAQDIFYGGTSGKFDDTLLKLFDILQRIGRRTPKNEFRFFNKAEYMWDLYALPFSIDSLRELQSTLLNSTEISDDQINKGALVTHGIFISVNCVGRVNPQSNAHPNGDGLSRREVRSRLSSFELARREDGSPLAVEKVLVKLPSRIM